MSSNRWKFYDVENDGEQLKWTSNSLTLFIQNNLWFINSWEQYIEQFYYYVESFLQFYFKPGLNKNQSSDKEF